MGHSESRIDTKGLDGVRDMDLGSEAGKEEARVGEGMTRGLTTRRGNRSVRVSA